MENLIIITSIDNENSTFYFNYIGEPGRDIIIRIWDTSTKLQIYYCIFENIQNINYFVYTGPNNFNHLKKVKVDVCDKNYKILQELFFETSYEFEPEINELQIKEDDKTSIWQIYHDIFNENEYNRYFDIEEGDIVVDLGANYGLFSLFALKRNPSRIICVEPEKETYSCLLYNLSNTIAECVNVGISDKTGTVDIIMDDLSVCQKLSKFDNSQQNTQIIDVLNINDFVRQYNLDKIDFLKIDIEGSEYDLFETIDDGYLQNNVYKIAVEFHFNNNNEISKIINKLESCCFNILNKAEWYGEMGMLYAINNKEWITLNMENGIDIKEKILAVKKPNVKILLKSTTPVDIEIQKMVDKFILFR